ncbi:TonB-dependent receptor [Halothiobacillus sp. DCM-1]|uniref:TonB-dependent receptor n=1 Tax=Halothiobacillus sp. DCM-1 TaxID=3112558 RepID=UPI0032507BC5
MNAIECKKNTLSVMVLAGIAMLCATHAAQADNTVNLGSVQSTSGSGTAANSTSKKQQSAAYQAPTKAPLKATQPQSIIGQQYIQHNTAPTANYTDIASIAPSVSDIAPNGAGGMESQGLSMRGFQDGQYNVTFDGIPFADSNDFTHHSTSYFMPQDVRSITVDRGPGSASTIGDATFGGTIAVDSREPEAVAALTPYASFGSHNTHLFGLRYDTGAIQSLNGTRAYLNYKNSSTDGALTYAGQKRQNLVVKSETPIGDNTVLTLFAMYNKIHQNVPLGATLAQIQKYGSNYGLNNDPTSQAYYGYNYDELASDLEYMDIKSLLNSWTLDNKLYSYGYRHDGFNGLDPNGNTANGTIYGANNVPGQRMSNNYRSFGDIFRLERSLGPGTFKTGFWLDRQHNTRTQYEIDMTLGGLFNASSMLAATDRDMVDTLDTAQPYVEYDWKPTDRLTITPGVKYAYFHRNIDAAVNQKTGTPLSYSQSWEKALPNFSVHYQLEPNWTVYAQWAKGFLAPNLNIFYTADPSLNSVVPEQTTNTQLGTVWHSQALTLSADVYHIKFDNKIEHHKVASQTIYYNAGGATYKGVEGEATYYLGSGFSVYGNGSINSAKDTTTGNWLPNAPDRTFAAGLIFNEGGYYASLIAKHVGQRFGTGSDPSTDSKLPAYTIANLNTSYTLKNAMGPMHNATVSFQVSNLFNKSGLLDQPGTTADGTPLYWTIPGRSYMLSLSVGL